MFNIIPFLISRRLIEIYILFLHQTTFGFTPFLGLFKKKVKIGAPTLSCLNMIVKALVFSVIKLVTLNGARFVLLPLLTQIANHGVIRMYAMYLLKATENNF